MPYTGLYDYNQYLKGDKAALDNFVRTYSDSLTRYAYCYLSDASAAEDVMEETIATLLVKRKHFLDAAHFHAYLYKLARNKSIDYLRRRAKTLPLADIEEVVSSENIEDSFVQKERNRRIYICMQELPPDYREVLYLSYFEGLNTEEVCRIMKKNTKQVYNLLARAKAALKKILLKEGITHEDL